MTDPRLVMSLKMNESTREHALPIGDFVGRTAEFGRKSVRVLSIDTYDSCPVTVYLLVRRTSKATKSTSDDGRGQIHYSPLLESRRPRLKVCFDLHHSHAPIVGM